MHTRKEYLSCDSDAPQVGSARSDWTRVVKVNRRKTNHLKTRPYGTSDYTKSTMGMNCLDMTMPTV